MSAKAVPRTKESYYNEIRPRLMKERNYPNVMAVPRLLKVIVNMGVGEATQNIKVLDSAGLPRSPYELVRRPRQLHPGPQGPDHLPRGRLRQGREASGHERDVRDHCPDGRGVEAAPRIPRDAVPESVRR